MGKETEIGWTDATFNPWWGCVKVSPACDHCYAESLSNRVGQKVWGKEAPRRFFGDKHWSEPLKWNQEAEKARIRKRVFCGSMCDVMEERDDLHEHRLRLYNLIEKTPWLDWQLLTKRPMNFRRLLPCHWLINPPANVWLMTTVELPEYLWRIDALRMNEGFTKGLSIEPLLSDIPTIRNYLRGIDWVIVGGESGHGARQLRPDWVRRVRDECGIGGVPFFFKQWGEYLNEIKLGKAAAGAVLDGLEWKQFPMQGECRVKHPSN